MIFWGCNRKLTDHTSCCWLMLSAETTNHANYTQLKGLCTLTLFPLILFQQLKGQVELKIATIQPNPILI